MNDREPNQFKKFKDCILSKISPKITFGDLEGKDCIVTNGSRYFLCKILKYFGSGNFCLVQTENTKVIWEVCKTGMYVDFFIPRENYCVEEVLDGFDSGIE